VLASDPLFNTKAVAISAVKVSEGERARSREKRRGGTG